MTRSEPSDSLHFSDADGAPLPYLTADLPGIGGVLKREIDDFEVEEIPAYLPAGSGEFLYLWIEKRGLSSEQLADFLARALDVRRDEIGMAGLKDRHAVARQQVSVPICCSERLGAIRHEGVRVLRVAPHRNKLRTGHLRGNRFSILIRDLREPRETAPAVAEVVRLQEHAPAVAEVVRLQEHVGSEMQRGSIRSLTTSATAEWDGLSAAMAIAARIERLGCPNYFGEQRFGRDSETARLGFDLLRGVRDAEGLDRRRRKFLLRLALSAAQSALFNQALAERLSDGLLHRLLEGDVMQVVASGGPFVVEDVEREQARFEAGETAITGPMFGPRMKPPRGEPARREARVLEAHGLTPETFTRFRKLTPGARRPYLVPPEGLTIEAEPEGLRFRFTLPAGVYATVVMREFQKT
jgi:tRNA pseudouridine13 synthase